MAQSSHGLTSKEQLDLNYMIAKMRFDQNSIESKKLRMEFFIESAGKPRTSGRGDSL